jgi:hypothetical protein
VVIVVLNHNKRNDVLACLASVSKLTYRPVAVVVVDNASTDGSREAIRMAFPGYHLVESPTNVGASRGRNLGVEYAERHLRFDYVMFLDDDAEATAGALSVCVDWLCRDDQAGIVCGKTYTQPNSRVLMSTGIRVRLAAASVYDIGSGEEDRGQHDEPRAVDACGGFAFVIRRTLLHQLRGFDEAFSPYGWEEVDLCLRARALGYRTVYLPAALFSHKGTRQGRPSVPEYELNKARHFITLLKRHATFAEQLRCAAWIPVRALKLSWKFVRRGEASLIFLHVRGALRGLWRRPHF